MGAAGVWLIVPSTSCPSAPASGHSTCPSPWRFRALARSASWRGKSMPPRAWLRAWRKAPWMRLLSGLTSPRSTLDLGVESWIASLRASRASPTPQPGGGLATPTSEPCGPTSAGSSRSPSPASCSSRTSRRSYVTTDLFGSGYTPWASSTLRLCWCPVTKRGVSSGDGGSLFSLPAPRLKRAGEDRSGRGGKDLECRLESLPAATTADGMRQSPTYGGGNPTLAWALMALPAPRASIQEQYTTRPRPSEAKGHGACLAGMVSTLPAPTSQDAIGSGSAGYSTESGRSSGTTLTDAVCGAASAGRRGRLNPLLSEWIQGLPVGWSDCAPLETSALRLWWQRQRSFISRLDLD